MNQYDTISSRHYEDDKYSSLIGQQFGSLTVKHIFHKIEGRNSRLIAVCECKCGKETRQRMDLLKRGNVTTCGCSRHGLSKTKLYNVWKDIKNRCYRRTLPAYKWYGGRGIHMCDEWKNDPVAFIAWCKSHGYKDGLQIDRIDNDKGYSPDNCRFVTPKENLQNTSTNVRLTYRGEIRTIAEWSEQLGLPYAVVRERYCHGWNIEDIFTTPVNKNLRRDRSKVQMLTYKGETHTLSEWAKITNLKWWTVQNRVRLGWSPEKILETPEKRRRIA